MDLKKACSFSSSASRVAPSRCFGFRLRSCRIVESAPVRDERDRRKTHSFDKLLPIFSNHSAREFDLPEANQFVHLLRILGVEWTPSTTHLE